MHCTQPFSILTKSISIGKDWEYRFCCGVEAKGFVSLPATHNLKPAKVRAEWDQCGTLWGTMKNQSPQVDAGVVVGRDMHWQQQQWWRQQAEQHLFSPVLILFDLTAAMGREFHIINNTLSGKTAHFHINMYCWYLNAPTWFTLQLYLLRYYKGSPLKFVHKLNALFIEIQIKMWIIFFWSKWCIK